MTRDRSARSASTDAAAAILDGLEILLQPVIEVATGALVGVEALARFRHEPDRAVDEIIAEAHGAGFGFEIEAACVAAALRRRADLPEGVRLAVNLSPDAVTHPLVTQVTGGDLHGVVVEVTEQVVGGGDALTARLAALRAQGARIAVDDVGTGYAGLLRLATMRPDYVKIDRTVVTGVRDNPAQRAVLEALVTFSHRLGAAVIGEGIETLTDLAAVAEFDVDFGQGWAIGCPAADVAPVDPQVVATCLRSRRRVLELRAYNAGDAASTHGMHAVTYALSKATGLAELEAVARRAATEIGVDVIGVSVLTADGALREIAATDGQVDSAEYPVADYPATQLALRTGNTVEAHVNDPRTDPAEHRLLTRLGHASLLIVPIWVDGQPFGVLELAHRTHRRWTTHDIAHGRGLARHLGDALVRIAG